MKTISSEKLNYLDEGMKAFFLKYKYELIVSFVLVLVLIAIALGMIYSRFASNSIVLEVQPSVQDTATTEEMYVVHISGAVVSPGVYSYDTSVRIERVVLDAGGLAEDADRDWVDKYLNYAEIVEDGQKIFIPKIGVEAVEEALDPDEASYGGKISLNSASKADLMSLPGIGEVYAQRIIDNRPYKKVDDLLKVSGIGSKKLDQIREYLSVQ